MTREISDEWAVYVCVPALAWWWLDAIDTCLWMYRNGIDDPSLSDFIIPCLLFALLCSCVRQAWRYASVRIRRSRTSRTPLDHMTGRSHE